MKRSTLLIALALGLLVAFLAGCGSKQPGAEADAGPDGGELEAEANTGETEYPEPPQTSSAGRTPISFKVSVNKALVLPLSEDGKCWDPCPKEVKNELVESLSDLSGDDFESKAKALTTAMGAKDTKKVLPDVYVNIDCGFGQTYITSKSSAEDRLAARWRGAQETLRLSVGDSCAISVWDADDDGNDELLGDVVVQPLKKADNGSLVIKDDFGQVFALELFFDQLEGTSVWGGTGGAGGGTQTPTQPTQPSEETKPSPGSTPPKPPVAGASTFKVDIIKANLKKTKDDGQPWDAKIPFMAGGILPDPFVSAYVNGYKSENPFMETSVAEEKLYNEWKESGDVNLKDSDKIHFMVWDKDKVDHDLMGECITDTIGKLQYGSEITLRNCGQVDFLTFKITKK